MVIIEMGTFNAKRSSFSFDWCPKMRCFIGDTEFVSLAVDKGIEFGWSESEFFGDSVDIIVFDDVGDMFISPWSVCAEPDSSFEFFSGVQFGIVNPFSILEIDVGSDTDGSVIEEFDLLLSESSVQNVEVFNQGLQIGTE